MGDFELEFDDLSDDEFLEFCAGMEGQDIEQSVLDSIQDEMDDRDLWDRAYDD